MKFRTYVWISLICGLCLFHCNRGPNRAFVISKIRRASQMATVEFILTKTLLAQKNKRLLFIFTLKPATFMAYTEARVKAGIDFSELKEEDIVIQGSKISLMLPPVKVLNFSYPAENFEPDEIYTRSKTFLNRISVNMQEELFRKGEVDLRENLQYLGIEKTAQDKTRLMMVSMLRQMGFNEIYIEFKQSEGLVLDIAIPTLEE